MPVQPKPMALVRPTKKSPPPRLMPQIEPPLEMPEVVMMKDTPALKDAPGGAVQPKEIGDREGPANQSGFLGRFRFFLGVCQSGLLT